MAQYGRATSNLRETDAPRSCPAPPQTIYSHYLLLLSTRGACIAYFQREKRLGEILWRKRDEHHAKIHREKTRTQNTRNTRVRTHTKQNQKKLFNRHQPSPLVRRPQGPCQSSSQGSLTKPSCDRASAHPSRPLCRRCRRCRRQLCPHCCRSGRSAPREHAGEVRHPGHGLRLSCLFQILSLLVRGVACWK